VTVLATHFSRPLCHNCGHAQRTPFCPACGQQKAKRFDLAAIGSEAWQGWRVFELETVRAALALARYPGRVAREYVLGARKKHVHPLKLLLVAIGVLLLVLAQSRYLHSDDAQVSRAVELIRDYAKWSFSLGIVAIFAASQLVFRRREGFNATEHLVLAVYVHFLVIAASVVNLLPTLIWSLPWHKSASAIYMDLVEAAIVMVAFRQFFQLDLRRDGARLLLAGALFAAIKWLLLRAYAWALVRLVLSQVSPGVTP
jgi:hypothetical protein